MTTIDVSAQFGGPDAAEAVLPHFRALKAALKGKSFGGFPFPQLAFILRVDGAVEAYLFGERDTIHRALDGIAASGHSIEHIIVNAEVASTLAAPQSFEIRR